MLSNRARLHRPLLLPALFAVLGFVQSETAEPLVGSARSADGVEIHFQASGAGPPALVFVHGWSCDSTFWRAQVDHFARRHLVVSIDLAGHGQSGRDRRTWTMGAFGEDVAAVVTHLDLRSVVLIGHSMGGPVVVEAATRVPDRVVGVIGVDTLQDLNAQPSADEIAAAMAPFERGFASAMDGFARRLAGPSADPALADRIATAMASTPADAGVAAGRAYWAWWGPPARAALGRLAAPLAVINSDMFPTSTESNRKLVASYKAHILEGVGHFLMMEQPETFNQVVEQIVKDLAQR